MKNFLYRSLLATLLALLAANTYADLLDGLRAYREGNYALAFDEFMSLALNGDATAQFRVGEMYAHGEGVKQNDKYAFQWYLKAAAQDDPRAQFAVAEAYEKGIGITQSDKNAATWYLTSADHGNPRAQLVVGLMYAKGDNVKQDLVEAHKWLGLAGDIAAGPRGWIEEKMTPEQLTRAKEIEQEWRERYE